MIFVTSALAAPGKEAPPGAVSVGVFDLLSNASLAVDLVLVVLLTLSVWSWAVILWKWGATKRSAHYADRFLDVFWSGKSMDHIYSESKKYQGAPVAKIFQAGYLELQRLMEKERQKPGASPDNIGNLERALGRASRSETLRLERSLAFLATTGSTSPFIGLFGTVWGIMNAFQNIGVQGGASLATVAPGIAEALITTGVGLAAAIPAVMGYNYYTHRVRGLRIQMENFASDFLNIVKRNFLTN